MVDGIINMIVVNDGYVQQVCRYNIHTLIRFFLHLFIEQGQKSMNINIHAQILH